MDNQAQLSTMRREAMTLLLKADAKKKEMISNQSWLDMAWKLVIHEKYMPEITALKNKAATKIAEIKNLEAVMKKSATETKPLVSAMDQMKSLYISK